MKGTKDGWRERALDPLGAEYQADLATHRRMCEWATRQLESTRYGPVANLLDDLKGAPVVRNEE